MSYIIPNNIENELNQVKQIATEFIERLRHLEGEINYLFSQIKRCETMENAEQYFALLDKIQLNLAVILHEYDLGLPERLWRFTSDFDNFQEAKAYYFPRITKGEYSF
jgi:hypothetical protein